VEGDRGRRGAPWSRGSSPFLPCILESGRTLAFAYSVRPAQGQGPRPASRAVAAHPPGFHRDEVRRVRRSAPQTPSDKWASEGPMDRFMLGSIHLGLIGGCATAKHLRRTAGTLVKVYGKHGPALAFGAQCLALPAAQCRLSAASPISNPTTNLGSLRCPSTALDYGCVLRSLFAWQGR